MKKGLSPIVAVILVLLIAISLTVLVMIFLPKFTFKLLPEDLFNESYIRSRACLSIENVKGLFGFITIKNCGKVALSDFKFFLDGIFRTNVNIGILEPSQYINFYDMPIPGGRHEIYVTADYAESPPYQLDVPFWECMGGEPILTEDWYVSKNISCICSYNSTIPVNEILYVIENGSLSLYNCILRSRQIVVRDTGNFIVNRSFLYFYNVIWPKFFIDDNATTRMFNSTIDSYFGGYDNFWTVVYFSGNSTNYIDYSNLISYVYISEASKNFYKDSFIDWFVIRSDIFHNLSITDFFGQDFGSFDRDMPMTKYIKADGSDFTINFTNLRFDAVNFAIDDNSNTSINNATFSSFLIYSELPHNLTINNWGYCAPGGGYFDSYFKAEGSNFTFNGTSLFAWSTLFYPTGGSNNTVMNSCFSGGEIEWNQFSTNKFINFSSDGNWYLEGINHTMTYINSDLYDGVLHIHGGHSTLNFSNTTIRDRIIDFNGDNITFFGNITFLGSTYVNSFYSSTNVTRYFPTIIKDSSNYSLPTLQPAIINITNTSNQSIWEDLVSGGNYPIAYYTEDPKILFNRNNYGPRYLTDQSPGSFRMKVSQVCENSSSIRFLNNTPLEFTLQRAFDYNGSSFNTQTARGMAFDNSNFWVAASNNFVYKYTPTGSPDGSFNSNLASLRDVASDRTHLWLLDSATNTVRRYSIGGVPDGWSFSVTQVTNPYAVDFDGENFWVLGSSSVYKYDTSGSYTGFNFSLDRLEEVSYGDIVASNGKIWIVTDVYSQSKGRGVFRYTTDGNYDNWYFEIAPPTTSGYGLAYNGTYFWVMNSAGTVYRYALNRNCLEIMKQCDEFITFLPYIINKNNTRYCLLYDLYIPSHAINFSSGVRNSTLDCLGYYINGNDLHDFHGIFLIGSNTRNNTIRNCIISNFYNGILLRNESNNNNIINNIAYSNTYGFLLSKKTNNNTMINNTANSNSYGIWLENSSSNILINNTLFNDITGISVGYNSYKNIITGGSIISSSREYYLYEVDSSNNFTNTNFTAARRIYFDDTTSWFNYNNESTGNIWLKTNVSSTATITRKLTNWSQYFIQWNDTSDTSITARYNLTGLAPNEVYNVYNNSVLIYTLTSNSGGEISFTIYLPQNQEREIKVKGICDYYIFSSDLPYTINQNNSLYCAAENLYISGNNATIFNYSIKNSTLDCRGRRIDSNHGSNTFGVFMRINTRNNTIINCNISDFDIGVRLQNSYNNTILKNNIYSNSVNIHFSYSINNTISNNVLTQTSGENVDFWDSDKNTIENNVISETRYSDGVNFESNSDENLMRNNTVINVKDGFCAHGGNLNKFYNNTVKYTVSVSDAKGFSLDDSRNNVLENNTISGLDTGDSYGIYLEGSNAKNNIIKNNVIKDFHDGIYLDSGPNNNTVSSNIINSSSTYGIFLVLSSSNTLTNNIINNSGNVGTDLVSSYNNIITNNTITNSAWAGIYFYSSSSNALTNNIANNNYHGIFLESGSLNNLFVNNIVHDNTDYGFYILSSSNNTLINNILTSNGIGFYLNIGPNNTFINNTASGNINGFVSDSTSNNNIFINNIFNSNAYGTRLYSSNTTVIDGSFALSSIADYYLDTTEVTNNFTNTNFTEQRTIYFSGYAAWFNYNNETTGNIWLKTNISAAATITRKLTKWSQYLMQWNDTSDTSITARYNLTGLAPNTNYNIYNNSVLTYPNQNSGSSGSLSFTIYLPINENHNITITT